eukprot:112655_1
MKSFVAVSSVVVLIAAQFICETQGLPMRPVTLKETGGMKLKDVKTKGSGRWESLLANMKKIPGASNDDAVQTLKQELRKSSDKLMNVKLEQKNNDPTGPGAVKPCTQDSDCDVETERCQALPASSRGRGISGFNGLCVPIGRAGPSILGRQEEVR